MLNQPGFFAHDQANWCIRHQNLAMIISYSGETNELIKIAKILKEKKTPIIVLTSIGDNRLSHYASYILNIGSREKIFTKIAPFASQT